MNKFSTLPRNLLQAGAVMVVVPVLWLSNIKRIDPPVIENNSSEPRCVRKNNGVVTYQTLDSTVIP